MWIWRTLKFSETKPFRQVDLGANNIWTKKDATMSNISYLRLIGLKGLGPKLLFRDLTETTKQGHLDSYLPLNTEILPSWNTVRLWRNNSDPMGMKFHSWKCHFPTGAQTCCLCVQRPAMLWRTQEQAPQRERRQNRHAFLDKHSWVCHTAHCSVGPQQQAWHRPSYLEEAVPTASSAWAPPMCQTWKEAWSFPQPPQASSDSHLCVVHRSSEITALRTPAEEWVVTYSSQWRSTVFLKKKKKQMKWNKLNIYPWK